MTTKLLPVAALIGLVALAGSHAFASEIGAPFDLPGGDVPEGAPPFPVPPVMNAPDDAPPFDLGDPALGIPPDLGVPDFDLPRVMGPPDDTPPSGLPEDALFPGEVVEVTRTDDELWLVMNHPQTDALGLNEPFFTLHLGIGDGAPERDGPLVPQGDVGALSDLGSMEISLADTSGGSSVQTAFPLPEPATALLLALAGAGLMLYRPRSATA